MKKVVVVVEKQKKSCSVVWEKIKLVKCGKIVCVGKKN
jgi:hypothetical protein